MLPILPKTTPLLQRQIKGFGGIDRRQGAKESCFFSFTGVDNNEGTLLETKNSIKWVNMNYTLESNEFIATKNSEGETDIYSLGLYGFYKNGVPIPLFKIYTNLNIKWTTKHMNDFELSGDNQYLWTGDCSDTKLLRFEDYIIAIPQMLYTDGTKTYRLDGASILEVKNYNAINENGEIILKSVTGDTGALKHIKPGSVIEVFVNNKSMSGEIKFVSAKGGNVTFKWIKENGTQAYASDLDLVGDDNIIMIRQKNLPVFTDATIMYNRLWGVSGKKVYASNLGNPFSFAASDGSASDAWWADTDGVESFTSISAINGRVVACKKNATYEIYGIVNPFTIKDVSRSMGCVSRDTLKEVNGVLLMLTTEGISAYGGGRFVNVNEALATIGQEGSAVGIGGMYYILLKDGVYKYNYYTGLWTNVTKKPLIKLFCVEGDVFGIDANYNVFQLTGEEKDFLSYNENIPQVWEIESVTIGGDDFYAEGINGIELRLEGITSGNITVEISRDGGEFQRYFADELKGGWQIFTVPIYLKPCSCFKYKLTGTGQVRLRLIKYSYRKTGKGLRYE
ncbi:MAG: hypothetical protein IJC89_05145 [Clostridia bacterium]|nr:hypothetical protein [Clostridia bacterium]